jgi:hypothetical protein
MDNLKPNADKRPIKVDETIRTGEGQRYGIIPEGNGNPLFRKEQMEGIMQFSCRQESCSFSGMIFPANL